MLDELVFRLLSSTTEDEIEKDTIGKYMYYLDDYENNLYGLDTIYFETKSSYVIKDTVSAIILIMYYLDII